MQQTYALAKQAGFKKEQISIVPLSALNALNLKDKLDPSICPWYKGTAAAARSGGGGL